MLTTQSSKECAWLYNPPTFSPLVRFSTSPLSMPSVFRMDSIPSDLQNPRSMPLQLFYRTKETLIMMPALSSSAHTRATSAALPLPELPELPERQVKHQSDKWQPEQQAVWQRQQRHNHRSVINWPSNPTATSPYRCTVYVYHQAPHGVQDNESVDESGFVTSGTAASQPVLSVLPPALDDVWCLLVHACSSDWNWRFRIRIQTSEEQGGTRHGPVCNGLREMLRLCPQCHRSIGIGLVSHCPVRGDRGCYYWDWLSWPP